jgi:gluconolactonase
VLPTAIGVAVVDVVLRVGTVTRANQIWRLPLHPDRTTSKVAAFITLSGSLAGPDGLAMDESGGLAVAHCGLGSVWLFDRLGEPLYRIRSCEGLSTTNLAFGGTDGKTPYITEADSGTILAARLKVAGGRCTRICETGVGALEGG